MAAYSIDYDASALLHAGVNETPNWRSFLLDCQRRCRADRVSIWFCHGAPDFQRAASWRSGGAEANRTAEERAHLNSLRAGRVYSFDELGIGAEALRFGRVLRVGKEEWTAWLIITRERGDFSAADSVFLSALAPHLTIAMSTFSTLERQRHALATSNRLLSQLGVSWALIDPNGAILMHTGAEASAGIQEALAAAPLKKGARLKTRRDGATGREFSIAQAPSPTTSAAPRSQTAAILRKPILVQTQHAKQLEDLWSLSAKEARLAAAIANGQSLSEAAAALNLTEATARNYSKRIYAKTGARGLAELTRLVLNSVALLT